MARRDELIPKSHFISCIFNHLLLKPSRLVQSKYLIKNTSGQENIFKSWKVKNPWNIVNQPILFPPDLFIVYRPGGLQCWLNLIQFSQKVQSQPTARLSRKQPIDPYTLSNSRLTKTYLKLEHARARQTKCHDHLTTFFSLVESWMAVENIQPMC